MQMFINSIAGPRVIICCDKMYEDLRTGKICFPNLDQDETTFKLRVYPFRIQNVCNHCGEKIEKVKEENIKIEHDFKLYINNEKINIQWCCDWLYNKIQSYYEGKETDALSLPRLDSIDPWIMESSTGHYQNQNYYRHFPWSSCSDCDANIIVNITKIINHNYHPFDYEKDSKRLSQRY